MAPKKETVKETKPAKEKRAARPASTPEAREMQLVDLAITLAEKQLREGTAAASVINHFLKIASSREVIEKEMLQKQARLIDAKTQNLDKDREGEVLAKAAMEAMRNYKPTGNNTVN